MKKFLSFFSALAMVSLLMTSCFYDAVDYTEFSRDMRLASFTSKSYPNNADRWIIIDDQTALTEDLTKSDFDGLKAALASVKSNEPSRVITLEFETFTYLPDSAMLVEDGNISNVSLIKAEYLVELGIRSLGNIDNLKTLELADAYSSTIILDYDSMAFDGTSTENINLTLGIGSAEFLIGDNILDSDTVSTSENLTEWTFNSITLVDGVYGDAPEE
ncbi:MAG: hypothetical protein R3Y38_05905 [Rikenellaceae bacterium]